MRVHVCVFRRDSEAGVHKATNITNTREKIGTRRRRNESCHGSLFDSVSQGLEGDIVNRVPQGQIATTVYRSASAYTTVNIQELDLYDIHTVEPVVGIKRIN